MQNFTKTFIVCFFLLFSGNMLVAQILSENFESGSFSANGWVTSGGVSIVTSPVHAGTYAAKGLNSYNLTKTFSSYSSGTITLELWVRANQTGTNSCIVSLSNSSGSSITEVFFRWTGDIEAYDGQTSRIIQSGYSTSSWYQIKVVANLGTSKYDVYVNSVLKGNQYGFVTTGDAVSKLIIKSSESSGSSAYIDDITLTTIATCPPPSAVTNPATNITSSSTILNGSGDPGYCQTSGWFEWGLTTNYGNTTSPSTILGSGTSSVSFSYSVSGLSAGTTYHFRAVTQSAGGTTYGSDRTFTTTGSSCPPPSAATNPATNITSSLATLNGSGDPGYCQTSGWFEWGLTTNYGNTTSPSTILGSGTSSVSFSYSLTGLSAGTTYHFRAVTQSAGGTTYGSDRGFITTNENNPSIKPISLNTSYPKGTEFWVEVKVGDPNVVSDLYGISFNLRSDNSNCTYVDDSAENGGFLGSSVLFFPQKVNNQTVDIGISKISGSGANGSGIVAKAKFISSANISSDQTVTFSISDISSSNSNGGSITLSPAILTIIIKAVSTVAVWPGDCNNDKTISSSDIIPIGLYYSQTRPGSNSPGNIWQAYQREPWTADGTIPKRVYADANGDGTINSADIIPVGLNYAKMHNSKVLNEVVKISSLEKTNGGATFSPIVNSQVKKNTPFQVQVKIGDPNSVQNLYGISFKLQSNRSTCTYVDGSAENGGFLGTGSSVLYFPQKVNDQTVDIGVSKISGSGVNGSGIVARAQFVSSIDQTVTFSFSDVTAVDQNGNSIQLDVQQSNVTVDINGSNELSSEFILYQNFPNPFNPLTLIRFQIPEQSQVKLIVHDNLGREAAILVDDILVPGFYQTTFDGSKLSSGVYYYRITAGSFSQTKKLILMK